jgi:aminoglycoside phosphotransferase (APT) family kinase protein
VGVDFETSGIPTEEAYRDRYLERTGRGPVEDWPFYMAFSIFRLASISQGVYRRVLAGNVSSAREAANGTPHLAEQALSILHGDR